MATETKKKAEAPEPFTATPAPFADDPQQAVWDKYHATYPLHKRWVKDGVDEKGIEYGHYEWRVLVVRYRKQLPSGLGEYVYSGGPIKDLHPLHLAKIQARYHTYLGELAWLSPEQVDGITFDQNIPEKPKNDEGDEDLRYEQFSAKAGLDSLF